MKRICALTMVRNDEFFLRKWVAYYGAQLGEENLYVYFDGKDQPLPAWPHRANMVLCDRVAGDVARADRGRIDFLSARAAELFAEGYEVVIGTDVDEFLVVEPALGVGLADYLSSLPIRTTYSGLGIDIGQHLEREQAIDSSRPFLEQRHYGYLSTRYTKASVLMRPVAWGSGFHRVRNSNFHIDKNLYLFHFGCVDMARLEARFGDKDRMAQGWERHLHKRARTIHIVTEHRARCWEPTVAVARAVQRLCRPPYAWNKPAMFGIKVVVEVPKRFNQTV